MASGGIDRSKTQNEIPWHNTNSSMTAHYAAAQVAELYNALE